jgi:3-oxoacyl-[acyl-carrier-protein] synthase-3
MAVLGMGSALPGTPIPTAALIDTVEANFGLRIRSRARAVARRLKIHTRHLCRDLHTRQEAPRPADRNAGLAARAVRAALADAGLPLDAVGYLIAHTATPGRALPPGAAAVADLLGYDGPFVELRQACTGFANALVFASGLLQQADDARVVIVGSETGSVYFDPLRMAADDAQLVNFLQRGDGAAAIVLGPARHTGDHIRQHYFGQLGSGSGSAFELFAGGSDHADVAAQPLEFRHDFAAVQSGGERLFAAGTAAAAAGGTHAEDVDFVIPHQANGRMAELLAPTLRLPARRVFVNADRLGNTGSAAIWLALAELRGQLHSGQQVLALGAEATRFMFGGFHFVRG